MNERMAGLAFTLIAMRLRRVPPATVVTARISAAKAGIEMSINDLEVHLLAGGNVTRVVNAMISADKANIPLPFQRAAAIDPAGRNVLEAVQMSVLPKVIETPRIAAVVKDGIQLMAVSRVTVRTNIDRLVGGAGEETIMARVGEGMLSTIGSAKSHKDVLENPDHISSAAALISVDRAVQRTAGRRSAPRKRAHLSKLSVLMIGEVSWLPELESAFQSISRHTRHLKPLVLNSCPI